MSKRTHEARPLRIEDYPRGARTNLLLPLSQRALGTPVQVPFVVLRGAHPGPVLGISAAVHGNELNGIRIIHQVLERTNPEELRGSLLCAPVVNVPGLEAGTRRFPEDNVDLNHVFPGKLDGTPSQQYARAFFKTFMEPLDFLIDIHTASEGRVNTLYVRADLHSRAARDMALLVNPEIILHGRSGDGTLRNSARTHDVPAITLEAGNPSVFQGRMTLEGELGVINVMGALDMIAPSEVPAIEARTPVICKSSKWLRTRCGGLLETHFGLGQQVTKRMLLAESHDAFGTVTRQFRAPHDGVVIGMSRNPVATPGMRYCHIGTLGEPTPPKQPRTGRQTRKLLNLEATGDLEGQPE
jgi:uncharacterized protein